MFLNKSFNGCSSPIIYFILIYLIIFFPNYSFSQTNYSSFGNGINQDLEIVTKKSIRNFFEIYNVTFSIEERKNIINNLGEGYFQNEIIFKNSIKNSNIIIVKSTLIDENYLIQKKSFLGLDEIQPLIEYSKLSKKIINDLLDEYVRNLNIEDVFRFEFEISNKQLNSLDNTVTIELKNKVSFNENFNGYIENLIFVFNQLRLNQSQIDSSVQNDLVLYPVIIHGKNNSFTGLFLNNEIQIKLQLLVEKVFQLISNHSLIDNLSVFHRPNSYLINNTDFFVIYDSGNWNSFNFQKNTVINKSIGSNFLESESESELIKHFKSRVLKNSNCLISDNIDFNNLIVKKSLFKLIFPINIISLRCVDKSFPIVEYFYNFKVSMDQLKLLNSNFRIYSNN